MNDNSKNTDNPDNPDNSEYFPEIGDILILKSENTNSGKQKTLFRVVALDKWESGGPLTNENHGELNLEYLNNIHPLITQQIEHYCLFGWEKYFSIAQHVYEKKGHEIQVYEKKQC